MAEAVEEEDGEVELEKRDGAESLTDAAEDEGPPAPYLAVGGSGSILLLVR